MNKLLFLILFLWGFGCLKTLNAQQAGLNSKQGKIAFADFLFNTSQYSYAAEEYLKLSFAFPEEIYLRKRCLESYRLDNDLESGLHFSSLFFRKEDSASIALYPELVKIRLLSGLGLNDPSILPDSIRFPLAYEESLLLHKVFIMDWEGIRNADGVIKNSELYSITRETPDRNHRSPALALALSAIVPGSGKVYSGRWKDGITSFLFVGITAFQAYRAFDQRGTSSVYGWIMGGLSAGFYLGNIYGSFKSVNDYNKQLNADYSNRVRDFYLKHY